MANEYLYGAYGKLGQTIAQSAVQAGTTPVYVGTLPVNLIRGFANLDIVNYPVKLSNLTSAQQTVGYSENWESFSLCEAVYAHFNNSKGNIGPIYVINVLNPAEHKKSEKTTVQLAFNNGKASIKSDTIILDTLALDEKAEGVDFTIDYNFTKGMVMISSVGTKITGNVTASYEEVDTSLITSEDIIGGVTANGEYSGLGAIALLYQEHFAVCNLIGAPGWSDVPEVYAAMISAGTQINGHWDAFVCADIPLSNATIAEVLTWKEERNRMVHALLKQELTSEELENLALQGKERRI